MATMHHNEFQVLIFVLIFTNKTPKF